jgi:lactate permease
MVWSHVYDPLGSPLLSTAVTTLPLIALLGLLAFGGWSAHAAAGAGLATALAVAVGIVGMPTDAALAADVENARGLDEEFLGDVALSLSEVD